MSAHIACRCKGKDRRKNWAVIARHGNSSAFNGYHWTHSDYSHVICLTPGCCGSFRTKSAYVESLPDAKISNEGRWEVVK